MLSQSEETEAVILQTELYLCQKSQKFVSAGEVLLCARNDLLEKEAK